MAWTTPIFKKHGGVVWD